VRLTRGRRLAALLAVPMAAAIVALAVPAGAATVPLINVTVGSSSGGVAGYYGADDGHTHWRYVQTIVTASPTLENLNGSTAATTGAVGAELCDENGDVVSGTARGVAAQIGLYDVAGKYGVAFDFGDLPADPTTPFVYDDPCIDAGLINPAITTASLQLLNGITIHAGDRLLLSVYYNPAGRFTHQLSFSATDLSQANEHRSRTETIPAQSFTEYGVGVVSDASSVTAALNNNLETFTESDVNFYSSTKAFEPISDTAGYYGYAGLSQVQYVNTSDQPEISPNSSLSGANFTVFEGSTTP